MKQPSYEAGHVTPTSMQYECPFEDNINTWINNLSDYLIFECKVKKKDITPPIHEF